jgi:DNA helicase-2/ATP-dependent DNA helicase PcrA
MNDLLQGLNEKQKEAVLQTEGPVMAIAGAGSGKTSVLTKRIAYLIYAKNIPYQNILAITFTNKAAKEMKNRIYQETGIFGRDMWISTFHSMCAKILRQHIERLGYQRNFQIIDDDDTAQLVKSIMKKQGYDIKMYPHKTVRNLVLKVKHDPSFLEDIEEPIRSVVERVEKIYTMNLFESNLVDFDDLLLLTIKLLKEHKDVKEYYHQLFKYVLVDEFQDTNNIQYDLVKQLVNEDENIFIVGDEDQSIYAFRGANIENINRFKKDYPKYHLVLLEQNYRSTNVILKAANEIIKNNSSRIAKNLYSTKDGGDLITHYKAVTARDEVEFVANQILKMSSKGYAYNDFAILYRANSTSRQFEEVFMQKQIPYRIFGNTSFFKRREIKDFTAYLRFIINPDDAFSFLRIISVPRRGIGNKTVEQILEYASDGGFVLSDAIKRANDYLSKGMSNKVLEFMSMIEHFREKLESLPFDDFVDFVLKHSGYLEMLQSDDKGDVRYENIQELKTILKESEGLYEEASKIEQLSYVLEDISLKSEETKEEIIDGVTMLTLHSAKGLEFRVVFIVALEMGMFPLHQSMNSVKDFEEERRLMYVGVTRAKERLFLTNASVRQTYGQTNQNMNSKFLEEIPRKYIETKGYSQSVYQSNGYESPKKRNQVRSAFTEKRKQNIESYNSNDLNKGDKVSHKTFGDGVVVSVTGNQCIIAFKQGVGIKKLMKDHPAIIKK